MSKEETNRNRIRVEIYGQEYQIRGDASAEHIRQVARLVDRKMNEIARANSRLDLHRLAVLAAVNIADEYCRLLHEYEDLLQALEVEANMQGRESRQDQNVSKA